ncbi:heme-binding protein [Bradyrhizobium sp. Arg237L]|uniref:GlcG/HbpS family heme-binding protein n=1 Tax=Bradyrhizobium sp. Arg237L TaxID=3003352 RepID=UPI00249F1236|nr:heme-binding protein [Bradyrhizobium sp. Arg237L]MDI4231344.1 heme-binding protein [Bradyrhizobium sp. Arg237L]
MQLNSHQAQAIIDGVEAKARDIGLPVVVAVLDAGAHLKAFRRMDGAVLASIDIAIRKASTAVLFQANSDAVWEYCKPGAPAPGLQLTNGGLATFGGGIPLKGPDGTVIGALGVSGGTVPQDVEVAQAGLAAFDATTH